MSAGLDTVSRFVERVRRRSRALELAGGAVAFAAGTFGLAAGALTPAASFWKAVPVLVAAGGLGVAIAGGLMAARALLRPPLAREVADWIERAAPELRDSLATSVEKGPLAEVSARYAASRLAHIRELAPEPRPRRRARGAVFAASAVVLGAGLLGLLLLPEPEATAGAGPGTPGAEAPAGGTSTGGSAERERPAGRDSRGPPGTPPAVEVVVRAGAPRRPDRPRLGSAPAGEVLLSSPEGFERAVELFFDSRDPTPEDASPPRAP